LLCVRTGLCLRIQLRLSLPVTPTTLFYALSLHDALPISGVGRPLHGAHPGERDPGRRLGPERVFRRRVHPACECALDSLPAPGEDRKSTRLNSSHGSISYAVFCLKKKTYVITTA